MPKQVKTAKVENHSQTQTKSLYVTVNTYDAKGKQIGTRIVDMYHYGTRNWTQNHLWWAMHNNCTVETMPSTDAEVQSYISAGASELAEHFNVQRELA